MTAEQAYSVIKRGSYVFNIGQFSKEDEKKLNDMVRKSILKKKRVFWPAITQGTCKKTVYYKGGDMID
jgi:hypothetical protein